MQLCLSVPIILITVPLDRPKAPSEEVEMAYTQISERVATSSSSEEPNSTVVPHLLDSLALSRW
jgi:hypothetical protein